MKNIVFLFLVISLFSCKKEDVKPVSVKNDQVSIYGTWVVVEATMFFENVETGSKYKYSHFSDTKSRSSIRFGGSLYPIESIIKDSTTYEINRPYSEPGSSEFIVNNDSLNPYHFYQTASYYQLIEDPGCMDRKCLRFGGSAIPLIFYHDNDGDTLTMNLKIHEAYTVINNYNTKYFTEIKLYKIK
jgi:hypothetical protein